MDKAAKDLFAACFILALAAFSFHVAAVMEPLGWLTGGVCTGRGQAIQA
jgi:hypothetical protein